MFTFILYWLIIGCLVSTIIVSFMKETRENIAEKLLDIAKNNDANNICVFVIGAIVTVILWPFVLIKIYKKEI